MNDHETLQGWGIAEVRGPDGALKQAVEFRNKITQVGDQMYAERGAGVSSPPAVPTGMKLGSGTTAPTKTGAAAALGTYITGSNANLSTGATSALNGSIRRITYAASWAAGVATSSTINEVVIVNETPVANETSPASETISRAVLGSTINKAAADTLTITYYHDIGSA